MGITFDIQNAKFSPFMLDSIISLLIWDSDFLARCFYLVKVKTFLDERRTFAELCYNYYEKYKEAPAEYIIDVLESYCSRRPSQKDVLFRYLDKLLDIEPNKDYVLTHFGGFVQDMICSAGITKAEEFVKQGKRREAREHILESFRDAESISATSVEDYFEEKKSTEDDDDMLNFKSFIEPYDKVIGGFFRPEMVVVMADENVGKSFMVRYFAKVAALQGKNILDITLETPKKEIERRYDSMLTSTKIRRFHEDDDRADSKLSSKKAFIRRRKGRLWIPKITTGFSLNDLVSMVNNIEIVKGMSPDVIVLDSPDQMLDNFLGSKDRYMNEEALWRRLYDFTKERNITLFVTAWITKTASAKNKEYYRGAEVGGTFAKTKIPDTGISLTQPTEADVEEGIMNFFVFRHRMGKKNLKIKIKQNLDIGQPVISAERVGDPKKEEEEIRDLARKYDKFKRR